MRWTPGRALLASALAYAGVTLWFGRDVLLRLDSAVVNDAGDPLLNSAILAWNARSVPWTDAWFNFPIFFPARNALTFSEHLLGLWPVSTPLYWLTRNALVSYNLTLLLTFPLCGIAMYVLVYRLTGRAAAAFIAGLAFAFAPYRMAHLPHVQVLAVFWMPLAVLGLHEYRNTGRYRWLALFAGAWLLQGAANGYLLVFFSIAVALWVTWFLVLQRRWRDVAAVAVALAIAMVPLAPILYRYVAVHHANAFGRDLEEIRVFSADAAALACAHQRLFVWGWLRVGCKTEGEMFPGVALTVLCAMGVVLLSRRAQPGAIAAPTRGMRWSRAVLAAMTVAYLAAAISVAVAGPWRVDWGPLRLSASTFARPFSIALACAIAWLLLTNYVREAVRRASPAAFYGGCAVAAWLLALGPDPAFLGTHVLRAAPYSWLMNVPGIDSLRVPARFWTIAVFCLSVLAGLATTEVLRNRPRLARAVIVAALAAGILADGWMPAFALADAYAVPAPASLAGRVVLELPLGILERDARATFRAVTGGWTAVNGYSGYEPPYYPIFRATSHEQNPILLEMLQQFGPLLVVVTKRAPGLMAMVRGRAGDPIEQTAESAVFRLGSRAAAPPPVAIGPRLDIARITGSCNDDLFRDMVDGNFATRWECGPQTDDRTLTIELPTLTRVAAVVQGLGSYPGDFPRHLRIQTSADGARWEDAWDAPVYVQTMAASMADPRRMPVTATFTPRAARWVRLQQVGRDPVMYWSIAELAVHAPAR